MKQMPKISLILPSLNVVDYIEECLESTTSQSIDDIEIVCVDAGSSDGTREVLLKYAGADNRVRIIDSSKKSYGYQVNLGLQEAKGDYVGIVETDDFVETTMFEGLYSVAQNTDADVVKCEAFEEFDGNNKEERNIVRHYLSVRVPEGGVLLPQENPSPHIWDQNIWNGIYSREFLLKNNIIMNETPGAAFQDISFLQQVYNYAEKAVYLREPLYHYRFLREGSSTASDHVIRFIYQEFRFLLESGRIKKSHLKYVYARMVSAFLCEINKTLLSNGFNAGNIEAMHEMQWFFKQFDDNEEMLYDLPDLLSQRSRNQLTLCRDDFKIYVAAYRERYALAKAWFVGLKDKSAHRDIVLFGAGNYGESILRVLFLNHIWPVAMTDNNASLWGNTVNTYEVISPENAVRRYADCIYLVANKTHANEIAAQLLEMGVDKEHIVLFADAGLHEAITELPYCF